jgi:hypothetical protein
LPDWTVMVDACEAEILERSLTHGAKQLSMREIRVGTTVAYCVE